MLEKRGTKEYDSEKNKRMNELNKLIRNHKDFSTPPEVSELCHVSAPTVKRWLERKLLKGYRVGPSGHWRILLPDLVDFMRSQDIPFPSESDVGTDFKQIYEEHRRLPR
jgi:excisionase family DNA binding protein